MSESSLLLCVEYSTDNGRLFSFFSIGFAEEFIVGSL